MTKKLNLIAAAMLALGLLAGCGGGDGDGDALTKEEYLAKGNAICEKGTAELEQAEFDPSDDAAFEAFVTDTLVPNIQGQIDDLRVGIPDDDEETVNGILDDAESVLEELEADPLALRGSADPFAEINERLDSYGLTTCGSS